MVDRPTTRFALVLSLVPLYGTATFAAADAVGDSPAASWQPIASEAVQLRLFEYLKAAKIAPDRDADVRRIWASSSGDMLDRLAACLAKADDRVQQLVDFCANSGTRSAPPEFAWLADSETPLVIRNNMRLYWARWLVQEGYYDEAIAWTEGLKTTDVVAPDALLFYRAVAHDRLVQADQADAALSKLLERQEELPVRYQKLADLMHQDLAGLQDDSLDHIARRMEDIRRRLVQGRAGARVQQVENGVQESLDKMIKDIEKQLQQQAQASSAGSAGGQQSSSPMQDSQIAELKAPGEVEHRDIGKGAGWGNLPEKDREKALQEIGREFPSHYREVVEEYFRRLAAEESAEKP